jgi:hypothetical protein
MHSDCSSISIDTKEETLKTWVGDKRPDFEGKLSSTNQLAKITINTDFLDLSEEARALIEQEKSASGKITETQNEEINISDKDKQKILLLQKMLEAITGKKIKFILPERIELQGTSAKLSFNSRNLNIKLPAKLGSGMEYNLQETHFEKEQMSYESQGIIKTSDGREINFSVQLDMSRQFASQQNIQIRAGDAVKIDPLVINFNGKAPELTDTKFSFDLDSDGSQDQISFLTQDSGFLALDLNNDGVINNGSELFGPNSGNGFAELSQYDSDGNNWIDENDPIFEQLRIWTKDSKGNDKLFALGQKGVGAIYLGNIETPFSMKNSENILNGQIRTSGIYINENGTAGTIQQIDLTV